MANSYPKVAMRIHPLLEETKEWSMQSIQCNKEAALLTAFNDDILTTQSNDNEIMNKFNYKQSSTLSKYNSDMIFPIVYTGLNNDNNNNNNNNSNQGEGEGVYVTISICIILQICTMFSRMMRLRASNNAMGLTTCTHFSFLPSIQCKYTMLY